MKHNFLQPETIELDLDEQEEIASLENWPLDVLPPLYSEICIGMEEYIIRGHFIDDREKVVNDIS